MSRSIHTTWSKLIKEQKRQRSKEVPENKQKLDKMYDDLKKKRQIKRQIIHQRKNELLFMTTDPDTLPICVYGESEFIHYPISEKDIRAVLSMLPKGIIDGLKSIVLKTGYGREKGYDDLPDPDPYTGRPGYEILPGVFQPKVLGTHFSIQKRIEIYAYVYKSIPDFKIWNVCLKIYVLMTLAHELAHHFDFQCRMGRGRWLGEDKNKVEAYAENMEYKWLGETIIPYIEETYKEEVDALNAWILSNVGIKLPLTLLAGDPRKTLKNGFVKMSSAAEEYFYDFVKDIYGGKDLVEARIGLAEGLHYADLYDLSLEVIESVLRIEPKNIEALTLKADTYVHQGKYKEAEQIAREVLALNEDEFEAWYILSDIYYEQSDWVSLIEVSKKALDLSPKNRYSYRVALYQAEAMIETGDLSGAEEKLKGISDSRIPFIIKRMNALREEIATKKKQVNNQ